MESTVERGYGRPHQRLREMWAVAVRAGGVVCWRCGEPIEPGSLWDLGHDDADRRRYAGPEHRKCNRGTASADRRRSRRW